MKQEDFLKLEKGDKVVFTDARGLRDIIHGYPDVGTVMVKSDDWMDDMQCEKFSFGDDYHYFYADDLELYKE